MKFSTSYVCKCVYRKVKDTLVEASSYTVLFCEYYVQTAHPFISQINLDMIMVHDSQYYVIHLCSTFM